MNENKTDIRHDGTRWTTKFTATNFAPNAKHRWGAGEVHHVADASSPDTFKFMVKMPDGWHYAHATATCSYMAKEAISAKTGTEAWLSHALIIAMETKNSAEQALRDADAAVKRFMQERAEEIRRQNPTAPAYTGAK